MGLRNTFDESFSSKEITLDEKRTVIEPLKKYKKAVERAGRILSRQQKRRNFEDGLEEVNEQVDGLVDPFIYSDQLAEALLEDGLGSWEEEGINAVDERMGRSFADFYGDIYTPGKFNADEFANIIQTVINELETHLSGTKMSKGIKMNIPSTMNPKIANLSAKDLKQLIKDLKQMADDEASVISSVEDGIYEEFEDVDDADIDDDELQEIIEEDEENISTNDNPYITFSETTKSSRILKTMGFNEPLYDIDTRIADGIDNATYTRGSMSQLFPLWDAYVKAIRDVIVDLEKMAVR